MSIHELREYLSSHGVDMSGEVSGWEQWPGQAAAVIQPPPEQFRPAPALRPAAASPQDMQGLCRGKRWLI